jgi:hypothetical protein
MKQGSNISLVVYNGDKVTVERDLPNGRDNEHCRLADCGDAPRKSFKNAFTKLLPLALELVEIGDGRWKETARVTHVRVAREPKGGRRNFTMTIVPTLEFGGTSINTPLRRERTQTEDIGAGFAEPELVEAIERVLDEASRYVAGDRQQTTLALDEEPAEEPEHEAELGEEIAPPTEKPTRSRSKRSRKK